MRLIAVVRYPANNLDRLRNGGPGGADTDIRQRDIGGFRRLGRDKEQLGVQSHGGEIDRRPVGTLEIGDQEDLFAAAGDPFELTGGFGQGPVDVGMGLGGYEVLEILAQEEDIVRGFIKTALRCRAHLY